MRGSVPWARRCRGLATDSGGRKVAIVAFALLSSPIHGASAGAGPPLKKPRLGDPTKPSDSRLSSAGPGVGAAASTLRHVTGRAGLLDTHQSSLQIATDEWLLAEIDAWLQEWWSSPKSCLSIPEWAMDGICDSAEEVPPEPATTSSTNTRDGLVDDPETNLGEDESATEFSLATSLLKGWAKRGSYDPVLMKRYVAEALTKVLSQLKCSSFRQERTTYEVRASGTAGFYLPYAYKVLMEAAGYRRRPNLGSHYRGLLDVTARSLGYGVLGIEWSATESICLGVSRPAFPGDILEYSPYYFECSSGLDHILNIMGPFRRQRHRNAGRRGPHCCTSNCKRFEWDVDSGVVLTLHCDLPAAVPFPDDVLGRFAAIINDYWKLRKAVQEYCPELGEQALSSFYHDGVPYSVSFSGIYNAYQLRLQMPRPTARPSQVDHAPRPILWTVDSTVRAPRGRPKQHLDF